MQTNQPFVDVSDRMSAHSTMSYVINSLMLSKLLRGDYNCDKSNRALGYNISAPEAIKISIRSAPPIGALGLPQKCTLFVDRSLLYHPVRGS
jgi:hypothetical protein